MRASRLLSILLLLQTRGRMTAQALADEFEVSVRTVFRDIDQLSAAGIPVYADRGRAGGFQLMDGYRTRLTGLTPAEAEALFLAGLPGPAADLGLGEAMADARLKLMAALPEDGRAGAARTAARFHLDPAGWFRAEENKAVLPVLAAAVWTSRRLRIGYESWKGEVARELEPLGLVLKGGVWYLVARVAGGKGDRAGPRTYRVASIRTLELTKEAFSRPANFDLAAYWTAWAAEFEARLHQSEATVRLAPAGLARLPDLGPAVAQAAARTAGAPDPEGWVQVVVPIETIDHAARELGRLGPEAEVLSPPDLRRRMAERARAAAALYAGEG